MRSEGLPVAGTRTQLLNPDSGRQRRNLRCCAHSAADVGAHPQEPQEVPTGL